MARGRPSKKQQIVQAAAQLFSEQGYQGTSVDQVVAAAAVSKPTVYSNFPSKQVLWEEVLSGLVLGAEGVFDSVTAKAWQACWCQSWELWVNEPTRLAAYRIMWGEPYKMSDAARQRFERLEYCLIQQLKTLLPDDNEDSFLDLYEVSLSTWLLPLLNCQERSVVKAAQAARFERWAACLLKPA